VSLKSAVYELLDNGQRLCSSCQEAEALAADLAEMRERLQAPLRVAIVGIMKAGKSTFMNALMGANILYTGELETTYTVCWFVYGESPSLTVCFKDGTSMETEYSELEKWSVRKYEMENPRIHDVKYLKVHYPAEVLKTIEFIDTPGLNSIYGTDSQNTLDFLSIKGAQDTLYEAGLADAVIYAFSHTASGFDREILNAFYDGKGNITSPINSIGILTKVDGTGIWNVLDETTPVQAAKTVSNKIMGNSDIKQMLYTVLPVCAKICEGFTQMKEEDWKVMSLIAEREIPDLQDALFDAREFGVNEDPFYREFGSKEDRSRLIGLLGQYGILEVARLLKTGKNRDEIEEELQKLCGIQAVREVLIRHFSGRSFLIKAQYIFNHLKGTICKVLRDTSTDLKLKKICDQIAEEMEELISSLQIMKELNVLQMFYNGHVKFLNEEEEQDFLRVTGEYGRSAENRLGAKAGSTLQELAGIAQEKACLWRGKAAAGWMMSGTYVEAATVAARSCEEMYYHLNALCEE